ncbi:MAG: T9SS type A sorting domain-containing protein, partial [Bacteroidetes bacterium]|nr:T9SS type A sorting domain-containing protein [Bacteroidota bacterium]
DFGGNASMLTTDPDGGTNTVARSVKTSGAEVWAGTTIGGDGGFANAVPFTATETKMTVRVYSPNAGIPIRLKVEDASNAGISVETEDTTTVAGAWETLEFDFSNEASGTAALNLANTYDKASIFFYFGTNGAGIGADSVYYWDDVQFGADTSGTDAIEDLRDLGLRYYPNPVQSQLHIEANEQIKTLHVLNLMGREMMRTEVRNYQTDIDLSSLPAGVYLVNLAIGNSRGTIKVVKH